MALDTRNNIKRIDDVARCIRNDLALRVAYLIEVKGISQRDAAAMTGLPQACVSRIVTMKLEGVSVGRLLTCLVRLGSNVDIAVSRTNAGARSSARVVDADVRHVQGMRA